jgi:hypothetical protein
MLLVIYSRFSTLNTLMIHQHRQLTFLSSLCQVSSPTLVPSLHFLNPATSFLRADCSSEEVVVMKKEVSMSSLMDLVERFDEPSKVRRGALDGEDDSQMPERKARKKRGKRRRRGARIALPVADL